MPKQLWIISGVVLGLWFLHTLLCRCLVPCLIRWHDGRDSIPTTALIAAAGPAAGDYEVKIVYSTSGGGGGGGGGCAVCLEEYKEGERCATIVACNHQFHSICVLPWVIWHHTCPLCRTTV